MENKRFGDLVTLYTDWDDEDKVFVKCDCCSRKFRVKKDYLLLQGLTSCSYHQSKKFTKRFPKFKNPSTEFERFYNQQVGLGIAVTINEARFNQLIGDGDASSLYRLDETREWSSANTVSITDSRPKTVIRRRRNS